MISLPVVEIKELFDNITINNIGYLTVPIMENICVEFGAGKIWGTMNRSICQQQHIVDYEASEELNKKKILLPFKQLNQLLSLGIDDVELLLDGDKLRYTNGRTRVVIQLEPSFLYPKIQYFDGEFQASVPSEQLKELLSIKSFCLLRSIKPEYEKVLIVKDKGVLRSFVFAHTAMPCVSLKDEGSVDEPIFFEITDVVASALLNRLKSTKTVYLSSSEGSVIFSTGNWSIVENSTNTTLSSSYKLFLSKAAVVDKEGSYMIKVPVSELKKAIRISDITGYETVTTAVASRFFKVKISPTDVFVINDKSDFGISSEVHLDTEVIKCDQSIERVMSFGEVKNFLGICNGEYVTIYFPKETNKPFVLICNEKRLVTMPALHLQ